MHKDKAKKSHAARLDDAFISLREQLLHRYMAGLKKLLPELSHRRIRYAMQVVCRDSKLKAEVKNAMSQLVQNTRERRQKFGEFSIP